MGELDVSGFSREMFSAIEKAVELSTVFTKTPVKLRRNVSSDREEPVIVSKMELSELLLMEAIEQIESTLLPSIPIDCSIPYRPESATLRNVRGSLNDISCVFAMADVIALDRLMKQVEKDSELSTYLDIELFSWIRIWTMSSSPYRFKRWHLEKYIIQISDVVSAFKVVVAAVLHLLAFVFQYLIGYVDRGGSKTYSSGSFDFRANFVSLLLFRAAYFWIKSRQAALVPRCKRKASDALPRGYVYRRAGSRYEPRFFLRMDEVDEDDRTNRLPLGGYATLEEAEIVLQLVRFYYGPYGKDGGLVTLENSGFEFPIPPIDAGKKKRTWVSDKAKELVTQTYNDFKVFQEKQLGMTSEMGHGHGAGSSDPSPSALPVTCSSPTGIAREAEIVPETPLCPNLSSLPPCDVTVGDPPIMDTSGSSLLPEQRDSVLRQLVVDQKKQIENHVLQFVDLDHLLKVTQIQMLELQQENQLLRQEKELSEREKERLHQEIERLKSELEQVAKSQDAAWTDIMIDFQQWD